MSQLGTVYATKRRRRNGKRYATGNGNLTSLEDSQVFNLCGSASRCCRQLIRLKNMSVISSNPVWTMPFIRQTDYHAMGNQ